MDPKACLLRLQQALSDHNHVEAVAALNDYYQWRVRGGFEPAADAALDARGDLFADHCAIDLCNSMHGH